MRRVVPWLLVVLSFGATIAVSVGVSVLLSGPGPARTPVIVDYSPTLSDVPALLYVAARPDVDLLAVTLPGTGESSCAAGVRHTRQLLALVGRGDVPVGCGRERPLSGDRDWPEPWRRSADTLPGLVLPDVPDVPTPDAVDLLAETITAGEGPVTVLTLSSLTNLGALVRDHPDAVDGVERIVTMGGAFDVLGNVEDEPSTEWNLYIDPEATRLVLESGIPLTLVPLDATNDVPGNRRLIAQAQRAEGHPAGVASARFWRANADAIVGEGFYFWDELAATVMFEPDLVALERRTVVVIEGLGATVEDPGGTPVLVAVSADQLRFEQHLLDTLNGAPLPAPAPVGEAERAYAETLDAGFEAFTEEMRAAWSAAPGTGSRAPRRPCGRRDPHDGLVQDARRRSRIGEATSGLRESPRRDGGRVEGSAGARGGRRRRTQHARSCRGRESRRPAGGGRRRSRREARRPVRRGLPQHRRRPARARRARAGMSSRTRVEAASLVGGVAALPHPPARLGRQSRGVNETLTSR